MVYDLAVFMLLIGTISLALAATDIIGNLLSILYKNIKQLIERRK